MMFCHRRLAVMNLFFFFKGQVKVINTSQHKGWVRVLCSLPFAQYISDG